MRFFILALAPALLIAIDGLSAQQPPVEPGARVRATHCGPLAVYSGSIRTDCRKIEGNLVALTNDSVVLASGARSENVTLPRDLVTNLDVHRGRKTAVGTGALVGLLVGFVPGAAAGYSLCDAVSDVECSGSDRFGGAALFGALSGAIGALLGAATGALIKTERWEEVPLDRLRVSIAQQRDGFSLGLSVSF